MALNAATQNIIRIRLSQIEESLTGEQALVRRLQAQRTEADERMRVLVIEHEALAFQLRES